MSSNFPKHGRLVPFALLALSAAWAAVILMTERSVWPLATWIVTTVGPLTALDGRRLRHSSADTNGPST